MTQRVTYSPNIPDDEKWKRLEKIPHDDAKNPKLKHLADLIWELSQERPIRFFKLALAVARDGIEYESDVKQFGHEDIAGITRPPTPDDALDAYDRGHDDCDAKARLFVALCLAAGFNARLWPLWKHGVLQHVAGEVLWEGRWIHAETILARAQLGEMHTDVPGEKATGKWRMS
jgi:transglutaminase-like putative cysteine protease